MTRVSFDRCDMCDEILLHPKSGLAIEGQDILTRWAGGNGGSGSDTSDPFENSGLHAPMQGQVSITICVECIKQHLSL